MKKFSVKTIVAIGIGAALFFVLGRFVAIPSPVPNTNISTQYGLLAFLSVVFGPVAGALIGLIGHALIDFSYGWGVWWSWVIASAVFGLLTGFATKNDGKMAMQMDWPKYDESKTIDAEREMAVQVNGKLRSTIIVAADADEQTIIDTACADEKIQRQLNGMQLVKTIVVKNKIINLIVKPAK